MLLFSPAYLSESARHITKSTKSSYPNTVSPSFAEKPALCTDDVFHLAVRFVVQN